MQRIKITKLLQPHRKIACIKRLRSATNFTLSYAKEICDRLDDSKVGGGPIVHAEHVLINLSSGEMVDFATYFEFNAEGEEKKQIVLKLYVVRCKFSGQLKEFLLLSENEDKVNSTVKGYGYTVTSVAELSGPFKCGSVLMIRDIR